MYKVIFYADKKGEEPVYEYLKVLISRKDKDSRIKASKINDYIEILKQYGLQAGEPYIKHLEDEIWELRPLRNRILFVAWQGDSFVLLSIFVKKTRKTPKREIEKAKRLYLDLVERSKEDEQESDG